MLLARILTHIASTCLGEYYQSLVYLERLSIAQLNNGTYETLATIRYLQKTYKCGVTLCYALGYLITEWDTLLRICIMSSC